MPGKYIARLTVTPSNGTPTVLDQSFALTRDPMVMMSEAEMKQLYAFRLDVVKTQRTLREKQAQLDTAQRLYAAAKRAADTSGTKATPELKAQLAAVAKELADITKEMGAANAGRGGGRGAGAPAGGAVANGGQLAPNGGGRVGRGVGRGAAPVSQAGAVTPTSSATVGEAPARGRPANGAPAGGGVDEAQNPAAATTPETIQARLGTTTEMLNLSFNPSPAQKKTIQTIPADLQKQADRVSKVSGDALPALIKNLKAAGIEVKTP
jgi:hypothetical protein